MNTPSANLPQPPAGQKSPAAPGLPGRLSIASLLRSKVLLVNSYLPFVPSPIDLIAERLAQAFTANGFLCDRLRLPLHRHRLQLLQNLIAFRTYEVSNVVEGAGSFVVALDIGALAVKHARKVAWLVDPAPDSGPWDAWLDPHNTDPVWPPEAAEAARLYTRCYLGEARKVFAGSPRIARACLAILDRKTRVLAVPPDAHGRAARWRSVAGRLSG